MSSVGVMYTTRFPAASVSTFWNSTVGKIGSPSLATPVASLLSRLPFVVMKAVTFTIEPSFTERSLILTVPVAPSIVIGVPEPNDHVSPFLDAV